MDRNETWSQKKNPEEKLLFLEKYFRFEKCTFFFKGKKAFPKKRRFLGFNVKRKKSGINGIS